MSSIITPNHCINELIFRDMSREAQREILAATCNGDGKVDFGVLVPKPLNMWQGSVSSLHEQTFKRTGLGWAIDNWGTKWNAYGHEPIERTSDTLTLRFQTAWGPAYPWLAAVLNGLGLPFEHNWLSEGGGDGKSGKFAPEGKWGGPEWSEVSATPEMHRHLHKLLWGVEEFENEPLSP